MWETFDLSFDVFLPTPDPEKVEAQFQDLRGKIQKHFSDGAGQALVMADNLPKSYFDNVMSVFNAFPKLLRVFIVTSNDETLTERDLDAAGPVIERVELPKLTADEVQAFIAERVPKYLACNIPILSTDEALALFPFANTAPQSAVGTAGSKPIGAVNMWLRRRVLEQHRELLERKDLLDVAKAGLAELRTRLIP